MRPRTREASRTVSFHCRCVSTHTASHQVSAKGSMGRAAGWLSSLQQNMPLTHRHASSSCSCREKHAPREQNPKFAHDKLLNHNDKKLQEQHFGDSCNELEGRFCPYYQSPKYSLQSPPCTMHPMICSTTLSRNYRGCCVDRKHMPLESSCSSELVTHGLAHSGVPEGIVAHACMK